MTTEDKIRKYADEVRGTPLITTKNWNIATDNPPWQESHYHKGCKEGYVLTAGWAIFVFKIPGEHNPQYKLIRPRGIIYFDSKEAHAVLFGPGTDYHTLQSGKPEGNPDCEHKDWWPADESFSIGAESLIEEINGDIEKIIG